MRARKKTAIQQVRSSSRSSSFLFAEIDRCIEHSKETLNKPVSLTCCVFSHASASLRLRFFSVAARFGGPLVSSNLRSRVRLVPEAAVSSAADRGSPARTPQTAGWHSSSVLGNAASQIRSSASLPQTRAPLSSAPSTSSGSWPAPFRPYDPGSAGADECAPRPEARTPGSLRSIRDRPDRPTLAFLRRALDRAAPPSRLPWPPWPLPWG